jgi:hypothetical protein
VQTHSHSRGNSSHSAALPTVANPNIDPRIVRTRQPLSECDFLKHATPLNARSQVGIEWDASLADAGVCCLMDNRNRHIGSRIVLDELRAEVTRLGPRKMGGAHVACRGHHEAVQVTTYAVAPSWVKPLNQQKGPRTRVARPTLPSRLRDRCKARIPAPLHDAPSVEGQPPDVAVREASRVSRRCTRDGGVRSTSQARRLERVPGIEQARRVRATVSPGDPTGETAGTKRGPARPAQSSRGAPGSSVACGTRSRRWQCSRPAS